MRAWLFQLQGALHGLFVSLWHLVSFSFSRRSRWRSVRMWAVAQDPFVEKRIALSAFLTESFVITVGPLKSNPHNASEYELVCLAALVKALRAEQVFEIGTYDGRSSRAMAMSLPPQGCLHTLNLPPGEDHNEAGVRNVDSLLNLKVISGCRFHDTPESGRIVQLFGDSASFNFEPYAGKMDLVFIDGSHAYDYVKKDTETALRLLEPSGGWIVWHDAPLYGVAPYLTLQMRREQWPVRLIEGTTLAVMPVAEGRPAPWPNLPLPPL